MWLWRGGGGLYRLKLHPEILGWNPCWFDIDVDIEGERGESRVRRCLAGAGWRALPGIDSTKGDQQARERATDGRTDGLSMRGAKSTDYNPHNPPPRRHCHCHRHRHRHPFSGMTHDSKKEASVRTREMGANTNMA